MRVVIVEDSGLLRDALTRLLSDFDIEVVAAVPSAEGLRRAAGTLRRLRRRRPPAADLHGRGRARGHDLRTRDPEAKVLLLSQAVEALRARPPRPAGEGLLLLKDRVADGAEFVDALRRVAANGTALDPSRPAAARPRRAIDDLSPRERQVLELMAEGRTNAAIARRLVVTDRAIEKHVASIFGKLRLPRARDHRRVLAVLAWLNSS